MDRIEVIVIGGGIAGASLVYFLAELGITDVLLLEREGQPGQHSTGRSAAVLAELDAQPVVMRLKMLGGEFLRHPPEDFCETPLLEPSGVMVLFRDPLWSMVQSLAAEMGIAGVRTELLAPAEAVRRVPALIAERMDGALLLPDDGRIDVHALLTSYLRHARRRGVEQRFASEALDVVSEGGRCVGVATAAGVVRARWVVDAAGAWAGKVARAAGAAPIRLVPKRRTIVILPAPDGLDIRAWPFVNSECDRVYFAPESGGLLLSPMDEEPMEPCDVRPDELVVAEALERLGVVAPALVPRTLRRTWAGLRTFAPDGAPVVGEDPRLPGFFWLAGQGGFGIETSPALGAIAADLIATGKTTRFNASLLAPTRFDPRP
jgi:D-arginine dehydrogenase